MAVNLSPVGGVAAQFFTNTGAVLTGGKLYTYAAGTTTPAVTYTSSNGLTAWTNPIVLDAAGRVPSGGEIWLTDGINYKFVLKDANDVLIATYDNISGINSNYIAFTNSQEIQTATAGQTVFTLTTMQYQPATNSLSVFVDGVNQYGPGAQYSYVETDSTTVTFNAGLHVGAEVKFTSTQQQGAGAVDASQVTYDPPFTGSVATNVETKLSEYISVKDFGAVGDGVTDDTAAIQAANDAIYASRVTYGATYSAPILWFPSGVYRITSQVTLFEQCHVEGNNAIINIDFNGYGFFTQGHKFLCRGMKFENGKGAFEVQTYNVNTAMNEWHYCEFRNNTEFAIKFDDTGAAGGSNSTTGRAVQCNFYGGNQILRSTADYFELVDCWMQPYPSVAQLCAIDLVRGHLTIRRCVGVPNRPVGSTDFYRWVTIENGVGAFLICENTRFGGEDGGWCIAVSDAAFSASVQTGIIIRDSECYAATPLGSDAATLVYLNNIPNKVQIENVWGFTATNAKSVVRLDSAIDPSSSTYRAAILAGTIDVKILNVSKMNSLEAKTIALMAAPYPYKQFQATNYKFGNAENMSSGSQPTLGQALGVFGSTPDANERGVIYVDVLLTTASASANFCVYSAKYAITLLSGSGVSPTLTSSIKTIYEDTASPSGITVSATLSIDSTQTIKLLFTNSASVNMNIIYKMTGIMANQANEVIQETRFA